MKKFVKPLICFVLAAVFVTLLIIPSHLPAAGPAVMSGEVSFNGEVLICLCPDNDSSCQCVIIKPPVD